MSYQYTSHKRWFKDIYFLGIYLIYLGCLTFRPFEFSLGEGKVYLSLPLAKKINLLFQLNMVDFLLNILLFIPFGIILYFFLKKYSPNGKTKLLIPILAGLLLSVSIEFIQIFNQRFTSFWDVVSNTLGCLFGFIIIKNDFFRNRILKSISKIWSKKYIPLSLLIIYIIFLFLLLYYPYNINTLKNWDSSYPLLLGNEATYDRPWRGEIFKVALYNKRLSFDKVNELFQRGSRDYSLSARNESGLILLYDFKEESGEIVQDLIGGFDLIAENVYWLDKSGIRIDSTSRVKSITKIYQITDLIQSTSEFSVELWCRTLDLYQKGPARIISLSITPKHRNFTLGQNGKNIHLRVRTPVTGVNGSEINLIAFSVLKDTNVCHMVAVFDHGFERLFFNGKVAPDIIRADINYLPFILGLGKTHFSTICFCLLIFLPLGLLISQVFLKFNLYALLIIVLFIVGLSQYFYYIFVGQPFGVELFIYGILFTLIGDIPAYNFFKMID